MSRRRRRHRDRISHERWLVSYADFITLLFAFFVVMYSTAQVDKKKVGQMAAAIQTAFKQMGAFPSGAQIDPGVLQNLPQLPKPSSATDSEHGDLANLREELKRMLAEEIEKGEVAVHEGPDGLVISLREIGFFDSGSAGIREGSQVVFSHIAALLALHPYSVRVEGHTDNVPIHTAQFPSNWELSNARATELVRLLITKYGFSPARLSSAGYAEYHPIASNDTPEGQAQNRRVDIVVLRELATGENSPQSSQPLSKPSPSRAK